MPPLDTMKLAGPVMLLLHTDNSALLDNDVLVRRTRVLDHGPAD